MPAYLRILIASLILLLLGACASLRPEPPEVSLIGLQIEELTLSHINMRADLRLFNPNRIGLTIEQVDYALALNGVRVSAGKSMSAVRIAAGDSADVALRISGSYLTLLQLINNLHRQEDLKYLLDGSVKVRGMGILGRTFPLREEGVISAEFLRGTTR